MNANRYIWMVEHDIRDGCENRPRTLFWFVVVAVLVFFLPGLLRAEESWSCCEQEQKGHVITPDGWTWSDTDQVWWREKRPPGKGWQFDAQTRKWWRWAKLPGCPCEYGSDCGCLSIGTPCRCLSTLIVPVQSPQPVFQSPVFFGGGGGGRSGGGRC